jgi:hypothetical protein
MTDPATLTHFTVIAFRAIGSEFWIEPDGAPMTLVEADYLHTRGLIIKATQRREAEGIERVVVKRAENPPGKVLQWRRKGE